MEHLYHTPPRFKTKQTSMSLSTRLIYKENGGKLKGQRLGKSAVRQCFLDMAWTLHSQLPDTVVTYTRSNLSQFHHTQDRSS